MRRAVVLSKRASGKLEKLLDYLEMEWSVKTKNEFVKKLDKSIEQIRTYPGVGQKSELAAGLRKYVVTRQTSIYYTFNQKLIFIATIFDSHMNPDKLKKEIR